MNLQLALRLVQSIIAIAIFFQSLENLILRNYFSENGIWRWSQTIQDLNFLPRPILKVFDFLLKDKHFIFLLWARLISSFLLIFYPSLLFILILFLSSFFIAQRFRGSFNGGSDYMSFIILSALSVQALVPFAMVTKGVLWYIAIQAATSYFSAGIVKLKLDSWRSGQALTKFIQSPNYNPPLLMKNLLNQKPIALISSWVIMIFEVSFPMILIQKNTGYVLIWLLVGFIFHFVNIFIFGLNRFLLVWMATYPAIYFCTLYR
jgi:hypothetical protein